MSNLYTRRRFLGTAAAGLGGLAAGGLLAACGDDDDTGASSNGSGDLRSIQAMLAFRWGGDGAWIMAAQQGGFFEDEGLDVSFVQPATPGDSSRFVAAGTVNFGFAFTTDHILSAENVEGVVGIGEYIRKNGHGVGAFAGSGLTGPESLRGKTVGVTSLPVSQAMLDAFLAEAGMSRDDLEVVVSDFGLPDLLIEGKTDANVGVDYGHARLVTAGRETEFIYFSDFGVPDYPFATVIANEQYLEQNGDVARSFLRALWRGMEVAQEDATPVLERFVEQNPSQDLTVLQAMWDTVAPQMVDEVTEEKGYGWHDFDKIQALIDFFVEHDLLENSLDAHDLFTDEYLT